jgi:L-alanine-DL-glutamate epimerase-like enolase superfamily enzyme
MDTATSTNTSASLAGLRAKITQVEIIPLNIPFRSKHKISAGPARAGVDFVIVGVHTDQGVVGIGETQAWRRHGSSETLASITCAIKDHFTPRLIGKSPFDIAEIMASLEDAIYHSQYAQAAISDALFDIQGKMLNIPLYALLGGKVRDKIPMCGLLSINPELPATMADAEKLVASGYRTLVVKTDDDVDADVRAVKAVRERFGDKITIRTDSNAGMTYDSALELLQRIEPYNIQAAEQLLQIWDVAGMKELARRSNVPLLADESIATDHDMLNVIRDRVATGFQTKVAKNGGLWYTRKLWQLGDAAGMRICPGNHPCTSIATASVAHLAAAWPGPLLDGPFAFGITALTEDIVTEPLRVENGQTIVPDGPGLGLTLDEKQIEKLRLDR